MANSCRLIYSYWNFILDKILFLEYKAAMLNKWKPGSTHLPQRVSKSKEAERS
jgi:hypothetical protein